MEQKGYSKMNNLLNLRYTIVSFIKVLQKNGLKEQSELVFRHTLCILKKEFKKEPLILLKEIINKSKPFCEIKSIRISGNNYKVPVEIKSIRQKVVALKWIISNSCKRLDLSLPQSLAKELIDTHKLISKTIKMCDEFHKTAESNKVYMQFRN